MALVVADTAVVDVPVLACEGYGGAAPGYPYRTVLCASPVVGDSGGKQGVVGRGGLFHQVAEHIGLRQHLFAHSGCKRTEVYRRNGAVGVCVEAQRGQGGVVRRRGRYAVAVIDGYAEIVEVGVGERALGLEVIVVLGFGGHRLQRSVDIDRIGAYLDRLPGQSYRAFHVVLATVHRPVNDLAEGRIAGVYHIMAVESYQSVIVGIGHV